ncbi:DotG/IcmE/VirB10 family protein [Labrenzia sp. DG1229]|uniref:DotG/IcmE/VirB10 family protein n=1 Tax=Labrenzia sp. DG1229 TaxID=681847 RepID=UPI00048A6C6C|nr:DotG/IcmE/VirB10 family protein [Labrenzia sp. DG1229]
MTDGTNETPKPDRDTQSDPSSRRVDRKRSRGLLSFRNIAIVSLVVVGAAVGLELWRNPELGGSSRIAGAPNVDATPAGEQLRDSERYQDNLRQQNEEGANEAASGGDSFIATPDEPLRDIDEPPATVETNPNRPLPPANRIAEPAAPTVVIERPAPTDTRRQATPSEQVPDYGQINQLAQLMAAQQQGLLSSWQNQPSAVTVVVEQDLISGSAIADQSGTQGGSGAAQSKTTGEPLIRAGDVVLASTIITNDSDTPGPVVVEIRRGPLKGARLIGGFQANQNNTHLIVQFNSAVLPDGTQVPVSAYAVDASQRSLAVRTDLDRRLFARYAPRVAATFVSGLGEALSDPGSTLVDLGGGVAGITRPQSTFEQGVYEGLAEVGNDLAGEFVRSAPRGPLISLRSRQIVGVLFLQNVDAPS